MRAPPHGVAEYVVNMRASPLGVAEYVVKMRAPPLGVTFGLLNVLGSFLDCFRLVLGFMGYWAAEGCRAAELQGCRAAGLQGCRAAGLQGCMAAWLQGCMAAGLLWAYCLRAFLFSCTQCWNQVGICARPYCIPALLACISTTFEHSLHASQYIELSILA